MYDLENIKSKISEEIKDRLNYNKDIRDDELELIILDSIIRVSRQQFIPRSDRRSLKRTLFNSMRGLDVIQPLIDDDTISEIMVNGYTDIFIERFGQIHKTSYVFESKDRLLDVIQNIVSKINRIVNEGSPIVDARLLDGSRVNIVLEPIALNGPILTIRKFPKNTIDLDKLIEFKSMSKDVADFLRMLVKARYNIFICGGTSSGKTTLLNALANSIPKDERLVVIEDSAELRIDAIENIVRLETRVPNTEGKGAINIRQLIKTALRMRPNRIIVGEVRGVEAIDMLQAMNTGHDGSISTGHANSPMDMISRLETMVLSGMDIPLEAIHKQIVSAIDFIIHVSKLRDNTRRIVSISELVTIDSGQVVLNDIFTLDQSANLEVTSIIRTGNKIINNRKIKTNGCDGSYA